MEVFESFEYYLLVAVCYDACDTQAWSMGTLLGISPSVEIANL